MIYLALKTHDSGMSHQTHSPYEETLGGSFSLYLSSLTL